MVWHTCERIMARHRQVWKGLVGHSIPSMEASGSVWIGLILLKLKIYCWNHCSKIIFKCVNSTRGPIFNEKVAKKWNLWVHKQYIMHCLRRKVNICGYCSLNSTWTVTAFCQNAWKKKKKKKSQTQTWEENVDPNIHLVSIWIRVHVFSFFFLFLFFFFFFHAFFTFWDNYHYSHTVTVLFTHCSWDS